MRGEEHIPLAQIYAAREKMPVKRSTRDFNKSGMANSFQEMDGSMYTDCLAGDWQSSLGSQNQRPCINWHYASRYGDEILSGKNTL